MAGGPVLLKAINNSINNHLMNQYFKRTVAFLSTQQSLYLIISVAFFIGWSDFLLNYSHFLPGEFLVFGGLLIPLALLVGAVQYKSRVAFAITMFIFCAILSNHIKYPFSFLFHKSILHKLR